MISENKCGKPMPTRGSHKRRRRDALLAGVALTACLSAASLATAADWQGTTDTNWLNASNWAAGVVPTASDVTTINSGTVYVDGAGAAVSTLTVGNTTTGALTVSNGGTVTTNYASSIVNSTSVVATIGALAGSSGTVTVTGDGSSLNFTKNSSSSAAVEVGRYGTGSLVVSDGATLTQSGGNTATNVYIGRYAGASGVMTVTGGDTEISTATGTFGFYVGYSGTGELIVSDGAKLSGFMTIASQAGSQGAVTVTGAGSTASVVGTLSVGQSGTGTLNVANGGTVAATGYLNIGVAASGSVSVSDIGSSISANQIRVGFGGSGTLTISNGSTVTATDGIDITQTNDSSGTLVIGAAAGSAAAAPGSIVSPTIEFMLGKGAIVINHTSDDYELASAINTYSTAPDASTISVLAGKTTFSGDSSGYYGTTSVTGGTLLVTGTLGGSITVDSGSSLVGGGTLGGTGTVGSTTIGARGTLSPGLTGAIGTLTVNGDLTFSSGSTYAVDVSGNGTSDLTKATGTISIGGGTMKVTGLDAATSYQSGQTYTVLTSTGALTGTFASTVSNSAFLDATTSYDSNNAYVTIAVKDSADGGTGGGNPEVFSTVADNPNRMATANALDSLEQSGASLELYNKLLVLDVDQANAAFDQLSGVDYASAKTAMIEDSALIRGVINDRLRSSFGDDSGSSTTTTVAGKNPASKIAAPVDPDRLVVWTQGFGAWGSIAGAGGGDKIDRSTGGFLVGSDISAFDTWRFGLAAGYSHSSFDTSLSSGASDNYHVGAYGGTQWGQLSFRSGLAFTWNDISSSRSVSFSGISDHHKADYSANTLQAYGEVSYRFDTGESGPVEPFANLAHVSLKSGGFSEDGGSTALSVNGDRTNATFTTIGVRNAADYEIGDMVLTARGMIGWRHAYGDVAPGSTQSFSGSDAFSVTGVPIARDLAVAEAGLDFKLMPQALLGVSWTGQIGDGAHENGFNARLKVNF